MPRLLALLCLVLLATPLSAKTFKEEQLAFPRVRKAFDTKAAAVRKLFQAKGLPFPPPEAFLRVLKREAVVELWAAPKAGAKMVLVKEYPICAGSGKLGPKRQQGDLQVPEGFYDISHFNPASQYHLSLAVSYPNQSDKILGRKGHLGGDIFIHGECVTIGCVPLTNEAIEELYVAIVETYSASHRNVLVDLFPARLTDEAMAGLAKEYSTDPTLVDFWRNLKEGWDFFESAHRPPHVLIGRTGKYRFLPP